MDGNRFTNIERLSWDWFRSADMIWIGTARNVIVCNMAPRVDD